MAMGRCVVGMAHEMRLVLEGINEWRDVGLARKLFGNWCVDAGDAGTDGGVARADGLAGPDDRGAPVGNIGLLKSGVDNAFMEGNTSLFLGVKRSARGYRRSNM